MIQIITGNGSGKTTSALGKALRRLGHGHKVIMIQFMKGRKDIGEYKIAKKLRGFTLKQFGTKSFIKKVTEKDKELAQEGIAYAEKALKEKPHLLILDEINIAVKYGLVHEKDVLKLLKTKTDMILTGRYASNTLKKKADIVTVIEDIKRPKKLITKKGITH